MKVQKPLKAVSNESDDPINDTPTSSPSPQVEMAMSWVGHLSVETLSETIHTCNFYRNGFISLGNKVEIRNFKAAGSADRGSLIIYSGHG